MSLFQWGQFTSSAGKQLNWKFDCDFLTYADWEALGYIARWEVLSSNDLSAVVAADDNLNGNAWKLANAVARLPFSKGGRFLKQVTCITDDVFTTGKTIEAKKRELLANGCEEDRIVGVVVLARGPYPAWVKPVLKLDW